MLTDRLRQLEERIGYCFQDKGLLRQALTHSSYTNEQKINKFPDYERLEFLGDAVLELVSSDHIFRENPEFPRSQSHILGPVSRPLLSVRGRSDWKSLSCWAEGKN